MIPGLRKNDRLEYLGLWTLEERRNRSYLLEVFRMFNELSLTQYNHLFTVNTSANTRGHSAKIVTNWCRLDLTLYFSERVMDRWNGLFQWTSDYSEFFQEWLRVYEENEDGLLQGLMVRLDLWPHSFWSVFGKSAAAPAKLPGKSRYFIFQTRALDTFTPLNTGGFTVHTNDYLE